MNSTLAPAVRSRPGTNQASSSQSPGRRRQRANSMPAKPASSRAGPAAHHSTLPSRKGKGETSSNWIWKG